MNMHDTLNRFDAFLITMIGQASKEMASLQLVPAQLQRPLLNLPQCLSQHISQRRASVKRQILQPWDLTPIRPQKRLYSPHPVLLFLGDLHLFPARLYLTHQVRCHRLSPAQAPSQLKSTDLLQPQHHLRFQLRHLHHIPVQRRQ